MRREPQRRQQKPRVRGEVKPQKPVDVPFRERAEQQRRERVGDAADAAGKGQVERLAAVQIVEADRIDQRLHGERHAGHRAEQRGEKRQHACGKQRKRAEDDAGRRRNADPALQRHAAFAVRRLRKQRLKEHAEQIRRRKHESDLVRAETVVQQKAFRVGIDHAGRHPVESEQNGQFERAVDHDPIRRSAAAGAGASLLPS